MYVTPDQPGLQNPVSTGKAWWEWTGSGFTTYVRRDCLRFSGFVFAIRDFYCSYCSCSFLPRDKSNNWQKKKKLKREFPCINISLAARAPPSISNQQVSLQSPSTHLTLHPFCVQDAILCKHRPGWWTVVSSRVFKISFLPYFCNYMWMHAHMYVWAHSRVRKPEDNHDVTCKGSLCFHFLATQAWMITQKLY